MEEKRVVIYARQSKIKDKSESCDNQIEICKKKIKNMNDDTHNAERTIYVVTKELKDEGFSGKSLNRPGMDIIKKMVENNEVDVIIAYKLDRISRNMKDIFNFLDDLQKHNVDIVSAKEKEVDTVGATGRAFFAINMVFAQLERDLASERSKDNNLELAKRGQFMGSYVKYGHTAIKEQVPGWEGERSKTKTRLEWNNKEAEVVKNVYSMYLEGNNSFLRISDFLNENGIAKKAEWNQPKKNEKWFESNMRNMLSEINYCENTIEAYNYLKKQGYEFLVDIEKFSGGKSLQRYDKKITILNVPPIIFAKDFILVQKMRDSKRTTRNHVLPYESNILLGSGILVCAECGKHMGHKVTPKMTKKGLKKYGYYHCANRECTQSYKMSHIKMEKLEDNVLRDLKTFYPNKDLIKKILEEDLDKKSYITEAEEKIKQLMSEISKLDRTIENMNTAISNISENDDDDVQSLIFNYQSKQLNAIKKKKEIKAELETLNIEHEQDEEKIYDVKELLKRVDNLAQVLDSAKEEDKKQIVHCLIKEIIVKSDNDYDIVLYFYEDLPEPKGFRKEDTPQGVRWKKID